MSTTKQQPKKTAQASKIKKKIWVPVIAPKIFNEQMVGETLTTELSKTVGKVISSNLMTLTGDMKKQSINVKLLITDVKEGKAYSKLVRYELSAPMIKRLVRRRKDRIDESLVYQTKDGIKLRIKPFLLTINLTKGSTLAEIRKRLKVFLYKTVAQNTYDEMFTLAIQNRLQKDIKETLSRIYPLRNVEIRVMHIEKNDAKITPAPSIKEVPKEEDESAETKKEKSQNNSIEDKKKKQEKSSKEEEL